MPVAVGTHFGRYEIQSLLGVGGMGEVYLAYDGQLKRFAAVKLLLPEFSRKPDRLARFQHEARATSALNHPNIVTIYEIGAAHDMHYIATEYIEGQTLRQLLQSTHHLWPVPDVLEIMTQVALALSAAHEAGIVHRDVKPENVMQRRDGYIKVLDFGLAKLSEPEKTNQTNAGLTDPGLVIGTVNYMSPEQARGETVDERSDIFGFGIMLYEMLAGRLPFAGTSPHDTLGQILYCEPPALANTQPHALPELQRILQKALTKTVTARYQTLRGLLQDLLPLKNRLLYEKQRDSLWQSSDTARPLGLSGGELWGNAMPFVGAPTQLSGTATPSLASYTLGGSGATRIDSLAVLPLANANADAGMEYLSDGITESLINTLSQLPQLKVLARATVFQYKGREVTPQQIRDELGVRAVLMGRVLQFGDNLIIKAELVDTKDGRHLWGEQYRRKIDDIFAVQDEISTEISEKLRLKLSGEEQKRLVKRYTDNAEAYRLYLMGRFCLAKQTLEGFTQAQRHFTQASALDPDYALAYAGLADTFYGLSSLHLPPDEAMPQARAAALHALELDDMLAEAHSALGLIRFYYEWDWGGAEASFKRAIEVNPGYAAAHHRYGWLLGFSGRLPESIAAIQRASELDPLSLEITSDLGLTFFFARNYEAALERFEQALANEPNSVWSHFFIGWAREQMGDYAAALQSFARAQQIDDAPLLYAARAHTHALQNEPERVTEILSQMRALARTRHISPYHFVIVHVALGETDAAFAELERAYETRSEALVWLKVDPRLDPLRADPRFIELLQRVGLPL